MTNTIAGDIRLFMTQSLKKDNWLAVGEMDFEFEVYDNLDALILTVSLGNVDIRNNACSKYIQIDLQSGHIDSKYFGVGAAVADYFAAKNYKKR